MNRVVVHSRVGADGILRLTVPMAAVDANRDVQVTIEPVRAAELTQEEWRQFVLATSGSITDPSFVRQEQGDYEQREELP